ncbi:5-oxoprolinase subunit B family protein [Nocardioides marmorisolisilvae]|uniref:Allophanate hydrolase subunit 1 n=1 Tax=Nocardioides marmorisolisilvae TaxID=1542737 RepID=A0A3N0DVK3_9ACTN|nr:allophanate hydrolase subunit 1 [Nocardioides marmorisolisilvae]RNL79647.1 allophanate hydrolase subunit 1 [Nocardioides marmorisolisilvae]
MRARPVGEHAVLVECDDAADVRATYAEIRLRASDLGAVEVVPAARTVLLDGLVDVSAALTAIADLQVPAGAGQEVPARLVEIPTRYDGEDLDEVARQWEVSTADVVRIHQAATFTVLFCGFAPGFAYCTGLPDGLTVSRRPDPRPKVPAGAVALAGEYTSVYPSASPGGWQLIGTTGIELWRLDAEEPALLTPGTRIRFVDE